ncbi:MAG: SDR family oxidoreductase [Novosphingobium sp.]|nr:SDR family oxidoreductase [Novosphingobium sp.]
MPLDSIRDDHFLILGGSSGMGYATAAYLLAAGGIVTICGRNQDKLAAAHQRLLAQSGAAPDRLRSIAADATRPDAVEEAFALAARTDGSLDGVFVVAGAGLILAAEETTPQVVLEQMTTNLVPLVNAIRSAFVRMKQRGGSILAMSSAAALMPYPMLGAYGASKAALDHYVRNAADEFGKYRIRVNAVRSGFTNTPINGALMRDEHYIREFRRITPLGAYAEPEQFAAISALLLSRESDWITGAIVPVDGGLTLRGYGGGVLPSAMLS